MMKFHTCQSTFESVGIHMNFKLAYSHTVHIRIEKYTNSCNQCFVLHGFLNKDQSFLGNQTKHATCFDFYENGEMNDDQELFGTLIGDHE